MSDKDLELLVISEDVNETRGLGAVIGRIIRPETAVTLTGDLGSGKTVFVQGLAQGLDVPDSYYVTSPTYTLLNSYPGRCPLYHFDLYRLQDDSELEEIGFFDVFDQKGVIAVEWADRLSLDCFNDRLDVRFETMREDSRQIRIAAHGKTADRLLKNIQPLLEKAQWV